MVAHAECTGMVGSHHVSLCLTEDSGEFSAYYDGNTLARTRLGYIYGGGTGVLVSGSTLFHRHRSGFSAGQAGDNMWSIEQYEGNTLYDVHDAAWTARDGGK